MAKSICERAVETVGKGSGKVVRGIAEECIKLGLEEESAIACASVALGYLEKIVEYYEKLASDYASVKPNYAAAMRDDLERALKSFVAHRNSADYRLHANYFCDILMYVEQNVSRIGQGYHVAKHPFTGQLLGFGNRHYDEWVEQANLYAQLARTGIKINFENR